MTFSGVLKLKFGLFWVKTSFLLVNVMPFGSRSATYVLRVERPIVCGGQIDLAIGHPNFPIDLLPRSANDCRKLRFTIRHGEKGKKLRFLAPNAAVYGHWLYVLRQAFEGSGKVTKRAYNETDSVVGNDGYSDTDIQDTLVTSDNDSVCGHRGSEKMDTPPTSCDFCLQSDNIVVNVNICTNNDVSSIRETHSTRDTGSETNHSAIGKPEDANQRRDVDIDEHNTTDTSCELSSYFKPASNPVFTTSTNEDQNVYCAAVGRHGAALFSVYVPPRPTRIGHCSQPEKMRSLSSVEWAQWIAHDIRGGQILPEVFRLTGMTCTRCS